MHALAGIIRPGGHKPHDAEWLQQLQAGFPTHFRSGGTHHLGPLLFRGQGFTTSIAGPQHLYFSGAIFNRAELADGIPEPPEDAALVQALMTRSGTDAISEINGQFTIIAVDARAECISLVNDHAGIRQLFYFEGAGFTLFASEIRFLLAHPECPCAIDWEAALRRPSPVTVLSSFIDYRTWFRDIWLLPEAGIYEYNVRERSRAVRRYWDGLALTPDPDDARTAADVMAEYMALLEDAVRIRCNQHGITHALLSGGLDSSAICALASGISRLKAIRSSPRLPALRALPGSVMSSRAHSTSATRSSLFPITKSASTKRSGSSVSGVRKAR